MRQELKTESSNTPLTGANPVRAVDQDEWQDRNIPLWFNTETVIDQVGKKRIVTGRHQPPGDLLRECRYITSRGMVLTPGGTCTKLTCRDEQIQVVRPDKMLRQVDDGRCQRRFTVVMCSMFTNVTDELRDLCKLRVKTQSEQYVS